MLQDDSHFFYGQTFTEFCPHFLLCLLVLLLFLCKQHTLTQAMFHLRLAHKVYASASKTKIIEIKVELGFYLLIFKCVFQCHIASTVLGLKPLQMLWRVLTV